MLDEYYRNGELFLARLVSQSSGEDVAILPRGERDHIFQELITDDFIKENYLEPLRALVGPSFTLRREDEALRFLRRYFEVSGKSKEILNASFFREEDGFCSYCGSETKVFSNRAYIFPFERKIDSITPENKRLRFCKKCGFVLYSGMAHLYQKASAKGEGTVRFFFDSYDLTSLHKINKSLNEVDIRNKARYNMVYIEGIPTYHRYETLVVVLFEIVRRLKRKGLLGKLYEIQKEISLIASAGSGQLYDTIYLDGNLLEEMTRFFDRVIEDSNATYREVYYKRGKALREEPDRLIFNSFFNNLAIPVAKPAERFRLRNEFVRHQLSKVIDFETLNKIIMERLRLKDKLGARPVCPPYYLKYFNILLGMTGMSQEFDMFRRINGLGYSLGMALKKNNLNNEVWGVFRARGPAEMYNVLVELQAKLKGELPSLDLRILIEHESEWRKARAILLNGMLNAMYGGTKYDKSH